MVGKVIKEKEIIVENEHDKTIDPLKEALVAKVIKEKENEITKLRSENENRLHSWNPRVVEGDSLLDICCVIELCQI